MDGNIPILMAWPASGLNLSFVDSIRSFIRNAEYYGHRPSCIISFDRSFEEIHPSLSAAIKALPSADRNSISVYDLEKQNDIKKSLKTEIESEILDYALNPASDGIGYGSNINANFLRSAGKLLISTDDDIICQPAQLAHQINNTETGPVWSDKYYPGDMYCYQDRETLLGSLQTVEADVIGRYETYMCQSNESLHSALPESRNKRIMTICPGVYGNSWMSSQSKLLNLRDESRKHLMKNYRVLRFSREIIRIPEKTSLTGSPQFIMAQSVFDNSLPIPPMLSYGRNAEGLSHFLLRLIYPESCTLYPNFGLYHSSRSDPAHYKDSLTDYTPRLSSLIMAAAMYCRPGKGVTDIDERFRILGSGIEEIGSLSDRKFTEALHSALSAGLRNYARQLEELLDVCNQEPILWANDVVAHLESVFALIREPERMFEKEGCGLSVGRTQFHFKNYGRLLACWPVLHRRAASIDLEN